MKTMKRLLALLLALSMVMPNCLTIASAYDEEIVEEVVEELVEEIVETPEEVVEEVFEEVYEEEIYEEEIQEEVSEQVAEEVVEEVSSLSSSAEVANTEVPSELETLSWSDPDAEDDSEEQFAAYANGILFPHQPAAVGTAGKDALPADSNALELYEALVGPIKKIADGETNSSIVTVTLTKALDQTGLDNAITALLMDMPFNLYWYDKVRGLSVGISGDQYTFYFRVAKYYATEDITEVNFSDNKTFSGYTTTKQELTGAANAAAQKAWTVATQTAFAEYSGGSCDTPYDRLMAYIEWIEGAVSYDYDALIDPAEFSVGDCNPWQIIYTFDGNPNTNVVCEGYSKSLQYLCEYAASQEIVVPEVFSVTGDSRDTTRGGGGRHMWNIAVLDGKNYLVDVTNADGGWNSILRGVPAVNGSYTYFATDSNGNPITEDNILQHTVTLTAGNESIAMLYAYDPETMELFGEHLPKLTLAETDYVPGEEKPEGETPEAPEVNEYPVTTQAELLTALAAAQDGDTITLCQDIDGTYITDKQITVVPGDYADGFVLKAGPGYVAVDNGWRIVKAKAQIGEVYYATLADAMKFAANADQVVTITMLDNDAEPCAVTVPVIIEEVDKYSINLTLAEDLVQSKTDGTLTIGTAEATVGGKGYATLEAALEDAVNGTVTLQKNIVREYPVQVTHKVTIITKGNTVKLTAIAELACITTNSGYQFVPAAAKAGNTGYVTLEAALSAVKNAEDKTITLLQDITEATVIKQEVTIDKNGKTADLSTTSDFIHTENGDVHTFVMAKARIGETNYASLKAALAAAQENDTIVLLAAPAAEEKIAQNVKIDLNGVMETVPVADGWEAVKDADGTWTVQKKPAAGIITDTGRTLALEGVIYINQYVKIEGFEGVNLEKNGGLLIWTSPITEENAIYGTQNIEEPGMLWVESSKEYFMQTHGIAAKEYADTIWMRVYVKDNDGNYSYSPLKEYSVRTYCEGRLQKASAKDSLKKVCAAMLQYGAAAQIYFGYNTEDLADKNVTYTDLVEWNNNLLDAPVAANTDLVGTGMVKDNGKTLALNGAVLVNYYFLLDPSVGTPKTAELQIWDDVNGELTATNYTDTHDMIFYNGEYFAQSNDIPAKEYSKTIYVRAHFVDASGNDHYSDVLAYNPEKYAEGRLSKNNEKLKELVKKMVIYGECARIYFAK